MVVMRSFVAAARMFQVCFLHWRYSTEDTEAISRRWDPKPVAEKQVLILFSWWASLLISSISKLVLFLCSLTVQKLLLYPLADVHRVLFIVWDI